jgi:hypothetical protein
MIRIGVLELGITCGLVALAIVIPLLITRGYARLNKRLKNMEDRLKNKDK